MLAGEETRGMARDLVPVSLKIRQMLYPAGSPVDAVYFPIDCVISALVGGGDGGKVEMATIGNEGCAGALAVLLPGRTIGDYVVQGPGKALRLDTEAFQRHLAANPGLDRLMRGYLHALVHQVVQAGACNRLHTMEERCARWLLMMHDRAGQATFPLTQEFLSEMLGVRRATANLALGILKKAGWIRYVRGQMTVVDRAGLESGACPCYQTIRGEYERLRTV